MGIGDPRSRVEDLDGCPSDALAATRRSSGQMLLALIYAVCLLSVPLAGGRLSSLGDIRLRKAWLAGAAIFVQVVIITLLPGSFGALAEPLHMASYVLLGAFAWANRHVAGVPIVALGGLSNFIAIAVNGGVMPADPDALAAAGLDPKAGEFVNSVAVAHPKLAFLGDVVATPASWPVHNVYSAGDLIIVLGVLVLLHVAAGSRLVPRRFMSVAAA
jgi:Family of unknown function (DUF5317)